VHLSLTIVKHFFSICPLGNGPDPVLGHPSSVIRHGAMAIENQHDMIMTDVCQHAIDGNSASGDQY